MKKILIAMFILGSIVSVDAKTSYTDYTFTGYTETQKEDDELHKYEEIKINKYYKLVKVGEYLEESSEVNYSNVDLDDYITERVASKSPSDKYKSSYMLMLKNRDNYIANKIQFSNINNYKDFKIKEIEVYQREKKINYSLEYKNINDGDLETYDILSSNALDIKMPDCYMNNTRIKIYYESDKDIELHLFYKNASGLMPLGINITLSKNCNEITIDTLKTDKFSSFLKEMGFEDEDAIYYYQYDVVKYKYYDLEKEYYNEIAEEAPSIEYVYDPSESYTMYKEYTREKIEVDEPDDDKPTSSDGDKKDDGGNNDNKGEDKKEEDKNVPNKGTTDKENNNTHNTPNKNPIEDEPVDDKKEPIDLTPPKKDEEPETPKDEDTTVDSPIDKAPEETQPKNEKVETSKGQAVINLFKPNKKAVPSTLVKDDNIDTEIETNDEDISNVVEEKDDKPEVKSLANETKKESEEDEIKTSPFTIFGIILLILSIVFDVLYLISVKRQKE